MKGEELRRLVKLSGLSADVVASKMGIGRPYLYDLYKKDNIGGVYADKVREIGLHKYDDKSDHDVSADLSAENWMKRWEKEAAEKEKLFQVIQVLSDQIELQSSIIKKHMKI